VLALGEALHDELRPHGVGVTTLSPGHTRRVSMQKLAQPPRPFCVSSR
jgi:short-subunit dehydrogenase